MRQNTSKKRGKTKKQKNIKKTVKIGTSKLEEKFAKNFLDVIGVKYVYQFEAKDIGRFYDFYLPEENLLIEIDGDYYHSYGLTYEEKNPMQKRNQRVDKIKDEWALYHGIPLLRIWEHDINNNEKLVFDMLKEKIDFSKLKKENDIKRKKRK